MTTIKSYTDLEQSKKLAEILPLESADMMWTYDFTVDDINGINVISKALKLEEKDVPAWSLAALLGVASTYCSRLEITLRADKKYNVFAVKNDFVFRSFDECSEGYNNPIDACYRLILKLNESNML
jgi:hypothetical protein